jgi:hypothetical protein
MMVHGFDMYRVYLSAPGDLQKEMTICRAAISDVNRDVAMPSKVLLVSVGLNSDDQIVGFRSAVSDNVRQCTYFVQVFEDDWGPKNLFRKMFLLALECREDAALPMREAIVCLKAAPRETDPEILAFRKELEEAQGVRVLHFDSADGLKSQLNEICTGWARTIIASGSAEAVAAG